MTINHTVISGNLTHDAELRRTANDTAVLTFSVAVNDRRRTASGDFEEYANYFDCVVFGKRAEGLHQYLTKGTRVCIEGKLRWSKFEVNGQSRSKVDIIVSEVIFTPAGAAGNGGNYEAQQTTTVNDMYDSDIPF
jgi:single-strand DNA-binding protein